MVLGGFLLPNILEPLILVVMAGRALRGPKETIEAFFVLAFFLLGNPTFISGEAKMLRYLVYFAGFASVYFRKGASHTPFRKFLWYFLAIEGVVILLFGQMAILSALKLLSFFIGVFTIVEAFAQTRRLKPYWFKFVNTFFLFAMVGSAVFLVVGLGYERNNTGFQGIFLHPQTFGPLMAVITAWFTGIWLTARKPPALMPLLVGSGFVFIYISLSRTAMGAVLMGGGLAYLLSIISKTRIPNHQRLYRLAGLVGFGLIIMALLNPSRIQQIALGFIQKREATTTDVGELFERSRGFLVEASLQNFAEHPLFGIGIGVPTDYEDTDISKYQSIANIPISASVEKGFLPAAILEEMGIVGLILTIIMLFMLIKRVQRRFTFMALWLLFSALLINTGEAILFSVGGLGLFVWLIIGMTYSNDLLMPQKIPVKRRRIKPEAKLRVV